MLPRNFLYYSIKPFIPRTVQILLRRQIASIKRRRYSTIWPINEKAATPPKGWKGWPGGKQFAFVIQHDVDTRKGHDNCRRLMDLEEQLGVRSCFNIVPERYAICRQMLDEIKQREFSLGVHGLKHDGKLFLSYDIFRKNAVRINGYLNEWGIKGFSSPSMISRIDWMHLLDIDFSTSTFDTDPFEPQPVAVETIFPFVVKHGSCEKCFVEMPYTLPQDFTLYVILKEKTIDIWKKKLDWIAIHGGMALVNAHPDYMNFNICRRCAREEYPVRLYSDFIRYVQDNYSDLVWNARPEQVAAYTASKNS